MIKYEFQPDSEEVYSSKGNYRLIIVLKENVDPNVARKELEKLTDNIGFVKYWRSFNGLNCRTTKETYDKLFKDQQGKKVVHLSLVDLIDSITPAEQKGIAVD
ncbi:hypothetical protein HZA97_02370 [Candidatus Woesearchaeota archaeon]|nr:hypothetical protein [Candidatus Woesearchaeota archaeon]